jgi:hypothetical protein
MSDEMMFMIAMINLKVVHFILIMLCAELAASPLLLIYVLSVMSGCCPGFVVDWICQNTLGTTLLRSLKETRHLTLVR